MENVYLSDHNTSVEKLLPKESLHEDCEHALKQLRDYETKQKTRRYRYLRIARDIVLYALAVWGLFSIFSQIIHIVPQVIHQEHHHHDHEPIPHEYPHDHHHHEEQHNLPEAHRSCSCGTSTAEAISLGCVYDSLSPAWLQPHCQDAELTAEFESLGDGPNGTWLYYADRNRTQVLSMEEVMFMADIPDARFHVTWEWHVVHCWMYWVKQFRSQTTGVVMEPRYDNEAHIRHCAKVFQNPVYGSSSSIALNTDIDD